MKTFSENDINALRTEVKSESRREDFRQLKHNSKRLTPLEFAIFLTRTSKLFDQGSNSSKQLKGDRFLL